MNTEDTKKTRLISIPFSAGGLGHGNGANKAPEEIKKCLHNLFANENGQQIEFIHETITVDESHVQNSHDAITSYTSKLLVLKKNNPSSPLLFIGGDHSITHPVLKGLAQKNEELQNKNFSLVVFDAHPDLMDDFRPPTQEDYLRVLIEEEIVNPKNIILLGVRNWDPQEINYLKEKNITCITAKEIFEKGILQTMREVVNLIKEPVYLSLDIDVVDPTQAIGTGYIEHGGLSSRELIYALQQLKKHTNIFAADLVEVNPNKDINSMTSSLAAKCLVELSTTRFFS
ncbi:MAG: arginase family protein [Candidatus Nanoarchaeia archaeon]